VNLYTERLALTYLTIDDSDFIMELVNTPGWLRFIGDRNVKNKEDAVVYIQRILDNPNINYWVVKLLPTYRQIGIITFIKRDYLNHHDLGFAFLPAESGKGYAYESSQLILNEKLNDPNHSTILATTVIDNHSSKKLLEKLGFKFEKQIIDDKETLLIYSIHKTG
jgi:ribosomal-protein-alanine N-acetyltransferase